jgi:hypothetical protein
MRSRSRIILLWSLGLLAITHIGCESGRHVNLSRPGAYWPPVSDAALTSKATPTAEECKEAIADFMRRNPEAFAPVSIFDLDRMVRMPLVDRGAGLYSFGEFYVRPATAQYSLSLENAVIYVDFQGSFEREKDRWVAARPTRRQAHKDR